MKLDATEVRYLSSDEYRVLTAAEMGSKNHEVVPSPLLASLSGLRGGQVNKCIGELAKRKLLAKVIGMKYDGYRLTYGGYDFLAMRTFAKRDVIQSVGNQIGTGKESDIYVVANPDGERMALKIHRLGRISFRTIKSKRDYLRQGQHASWMYMSRLAAMKEYAFMKILHEHGFPVPRPIDQARHCLVMELCDGYPLRQFTAVPNPGAVYSDLMDIIVRFARSGLIHGDFNEFNILLHENKGMVPTMVRATEKVVSEETGLEEERPVEPEAWIPNGEEHEEVVSVTPIVIDFPQMVSVDHENAEYYFNRDVQCVRDFFRKRFRYESSVYPRFSATIREDGKRDFALDVAVAASGFGKKEGEELDRYMRMVQEAEENESGAEEGEDEEGEAEEQSDEGTGETADEVDGNDDEEEVEADGAEEAGTGEQEAVKSDGEQSPDSDGSEQSSASDEEEEEVDDGLSRSERRAARPPRTGSARSRAAAAAAAAGAGPAIEKKDVRAIVTSNLERSQRSKDRKHHGKKGPTGAGRSKGSKRKADPQSSIRDSTQF